MALEDNIKDILFPTSGGTVGSLLSINTESITETIVYAAIGAVVGYTVKLLIDSLVCKTKSRKRDEMDKEVKRKQESTDTTVSEKDS